MFKLPTGLAGREFLKQITATINLFNTSSELESVAITMLMILPP